MPITALRPMDPTAMGPHRLLARLGQGGMGTVYLGVSPDERAVAVKVLRESVTDPLARRRFRSELEALRRIRGPHLVEVLDADVEADPPYLVTRFVPGERLDDVVRRCGPLPVEALRQVARGLADALTALHGVGVIHRDLTPGNVLVLDGQPYVIDLGLATAADLTALTSSGLVIGTAGYLAPEQVTGSGLSPAVDVHAWGATVAFAGTGRPPYGIGRPEAVLYRIVHESPDLEGLPPPLDRLVTAAMDSDPLRRPSAHALLSGLGGASATEPVTVRLSRDADVTTLLGPEVLRAGRTPSTARELVSATSDARPTMPASCGPQEYDAASYDSATHSLPPYVTRGEPDALRGEDDSLPAERISPARSLQAVLTSLAALALVAAGTLAAPIIGAGTALVLLTGLRAVGRSSQRLTDRRQRRGGSRRRDPLVSTLGAPWHLVLAGCTTLLSLPLVLAVAAVPAGAVWLLDPQLSGLERPELTAATATAVGLAVGLRDGAHRRTRRMLRRGLWRSTPGPVSAIALLLVITALVGLLLATAEGAAPLFWPAT